MAAICLAVIYSNRLTPQQNELEAPKRYPVGYKHDRALAITMASKIMEFLSKAKVYPEILELITYCESCSVADANRNQRDLLEEGEDDSGFFHDNEHQYRMTLDPTCPWVGRRPKAPPKYPWSGEWNDPALETEISDGEDFYEYDFQRLEKTNEIALPVKERGEGSAAHTDSSDDRGESTTAHTESSDDSEVSMDTQPSDSEDAGSDCNGDTGGMTAAPTGTVNVENMDEEEESADATPAT